MSAEGIQYDSYKVSICDNNLELCKAEMKKRGITSEEYRSGFALKTRFFKDGKEFET